MPLRRLLIAGFLVAGLAVAIVEASFIHSDDGCVLETHCNACLLQLASPGIVAPAFSLPPAGPIAEQVPAAVAPSYEQAAPAKVSSRGPPLLAPSLA